MTENSEPLGLVLARGPILAEELIQLLESAAVGATSTDIGLELSAAGREARSRQSEFYAYRASLPGRSHLDFTTARTAVWASTGGHRPDAGSLRDRRRQVGDGLADPGMPVPAPPVSLRRRARESSVAAMCNVVTQTRRPRLNAWTVTSGLAGIAAATVGELAWVDA